MAQVISIAGIEDTRMPQQRDWTSCLQSSVPHAQPQSWKWIPTHLTIEQFERFVLPHLYLGSRGPQPKLSFF